MITTRKMFFSLFLLASLAPISSVAQTVRSAPVMTNDGAVLKQARHQPLVVRGTYHLLIEDHPQGAKERHFVATSSGRVELKSHSKLKSLVGGQRVQIQGSLDDAEMLTVNDVSTTAVPPQPTKELLYGLGQQTTFVHLIQWQDKPEVPSQSDIQTLVFGTTNNFFQESSKGQTWLSGLVNAPIVVPYNSTECVDGMILSNYVDQVAQSQGHVLTNYKRHVYVFPKNACSWSGLALVNEYPSRAWINGRYNLHTVAHEMGHNFGLRHAHARDCDATPLGNTCTNLVYGDAADIMGNVLPGDFSPYNKERLGWLGDGVSPDILTADRPGQYTMEAYTSESVGPKAVRIPRGVDANGKTLYFYLEQRQAVGVDAVLSGMGNLTQGLMVRTVTHGDGDSIYQIDMTPNSTVGGTFELRDGALPLNAPYTDPVSGIAFELIAHSPTQATLNVVYPAGWEPPVDPEEPPPPPPVCTRVAPTLTLTPNSRTALANASLTYTLTVQNNDDPNNSACTPVSFSVYHSIESSLSPTLSATTLVLGAGASANTTLSLKVGKTPVLKTYALPLNAGANFVSGTTTGALTVVKRCPTGTVANSAKECVSALKMEEPTEENVYQDITQGWTKAYKGLGL